MRLQKSKNAAQEELTAAVNEGYRVLAWLKTDYNERKTAGTFDPSRDNESYTEAINNWADALVIPVLASIFPTQLEHNIFTNPPSKSSVSYIGIDQRFGELKSMLITHIQILQSILTDRLAQYTDLPAQIRIYVEDIDSFRKVRDVNPAMVAGFLQDGRLDLSEDTIQIALEQILDVAFHKKDWGGETNDLYTANVTVNGSRAATAFLLKGNGLKKRTMEIADCGKNGDQLVRLFVSPAQLFVVQFVGEVSEAIISDAEGKVGTLRSQGKPTCFCIMNGQDTARVLYAYGKLP